MKLFISAFIGTFSFFQPAFSSVVVLYDASESGKHMMVRKRLMEKYQIPGKLLQTYFVKDCPKPVKFSNKLVLCAKEEELVVLNSNSSIIKSLSVFKSEAR